MFYQSKCVLYKSHMWPVKWIHDNTMRAQALLMSGTTLL